MEMLMTSNRDSMNADRWRANGRPCLFIPIFIFIYSKNNRVRSMVDASSAIGHDSHTKKE
jgi:hypothetical protein